MTKRSRNSCRRSPEVSRIVKGQSTRIRTTESKFQRKKNEKMWEQNKISEFILNQTKKSNFQEKTIKIKYDANELTSWQQRNDIYLSHTEEVHC